MKQEMKQAVFANMFQATEGFIPPTMQELTERAHQNNEIAFILPFYVYCFFPHEWQSYTLLTEHPLPSTLNYATYIALDAPTLYPEETLQRFFYGVVSIVPIPANHRTAMPIEYWVYYLFRRYHELNEQVCFLEHRNEVNRILPKKWSE